MYIHFPVRTHTLVNCCNKKHYSEFVQIFHYQIYMYSVCVRVLSIYNDGGLRFKLLFYPQF